MASDYLFQQSEKVAKKLPLFFGRFNVASNLVKRGKVEKIGERDFRSPYLTQEGGRFGKFDPDGGDMGRGSASAGGVFISTYYPLRLNFELNKLAVDATNNKEVAQFNAFKRAMKAGLPEFVQYVDKAWHSDGTAVLGTATAQATVSAKTVYTMDTVIGVQHLRRGQRVLVYDNGLTASRDSGTAFTIEQLDYDARKVYLSATVTSAAATDKLVFEGVSGASPSGLKGLYYFNDYAKTGTLLGVNRANELEVVSNGVDASGVPTHQKALQLHHKILKRRGEDTPGLVGLCSPEQQSNIYDQVLSYANFDISRGGVDPKKADLSPRKKFQFGNITFQLDIHQRTDRLDVFVPSEFTRGQLAPMGFYETPGSSQRFFNLYGTSGAPAASVWFGLCVEEDFVYCNPGGGGVIYGCSQPSY